MAEYIERSYLLAEYDRQHQGPPGGARKIIAEAPAADVAPVRHGRWIRHSKKEDGKYYEWCNCSECGNEATAGPCYWDNETPFCPWCGAKMDGGDGS